MEEQQSTVNDKFSKIKANKKLNTIKTKSQTNIQKNSKTEFNLKRSNKSKKRFLPSNKDNKFSSINETRNNDYKNRMKSYMLKQYRLKLKNSSIDPKINHNIFSASK